MKYNAVLNCFGFADASCFSELNGGNINKTVLVETEDEKKYILQTINKDVFKSPECVMANILKICKHFDLYAADEKICVPHYLSTLNGQIFLHTEGEYYRIYKYCEQQNTALIADRYKTGYAFGSYIRLLSIKKLTLDTTIKNFHSISSYFSLLTSADSSSQLKKIDKSIMRRLDSVNNMAERVFTVDFPKRIVHNDAKYSNVIIDSKYTIIDLDTTMKGYVATDYGDLIRSVCIGETLDINAVMEVTRGFADGLDGILTDDEIDSLYYGILYVTAELSIRYFTDYLSDEKYFRNKTSSECLARANELLRQLNVFISCGDDITDIIYTSFRRQ